MQMLHEQGLHQKDSTEVKKFQKVIGGLLFSETPCIKDIYIVSQKNRTATITSSQHLLIIFDRQETLFNCQLL